MLRPPIRGFAKVSKKLRKCEDQNPLISKEKSRLNKLAGFFCGG